MFSVITNNNFLLFFIFFITTFITTKFLKLFSKIIYKNNSTKQVAIKFIINLFCIFIWFISLVVYLYNFDWFHYALSGIMAGSGIVFVSLSFIFQETIRDVIDGMLLILSNPFKIGDVIRCKELNIIGTVKDIKLLHTEILSFQNNSLIIPNSQMKDMTIENLRANKNICNFLTVNISYGTDIDKMEELVVETVMHHPLFIDNRTEKEKEDGIPPVGFLITDWTEKGATVRISAYSRAEDGFEFLCSLRRDLLKVFNKNCIYIAYPTVRVWESNISDKKNLLKIER